VNYFAWAKAGNEVDGWLEQGWLSPQSNTACYSVEEKEVSSRLAGMMRCYQMRGLEVTNYTSSRQCRNSRDSPDSTDLEEQRVQCSASNDKEVQRERDG